VVELEALEGNRVISSFVKYLRVEMAKGSIRNERLLEDLVSAEASNKPTWDTDTILGYFQRYDTKDFIRKAELELKKQRAIEAKKNFKPILADRELTKLTKQQMQELRSLRSLNHYIRRKREQYKEQVGFNRLSVIPATLIHVQKSCTGAFSTFPSLHGTIQPALLWRAIAS
jgi:hypothetical protein